MGIEKEQLGLIACVCCLLLVVFTLCVGHQVSAAELEVVLLADSFDDTADAPDPRNWQITRFNDFKKTIVDVMATQTPAETGDQNDQPVASNNTKETSSGSEGKLRLAMNTIGTDDSTVKYLGVRSLQAFSLEKGLIIECDLDWNQGGGLNNGSYMAAGLYLCPTQTDESPVKEDRFIKFEYIGTPPTINARSMLAIGRKGYLTQLYNENWPAENRKGRDIGKPHVKIILNTTAIAVYENGELVYENQKFKPGFLKAYVHLQMSSHSNYPLREIYFDNVKIKTLDVHE
ncbi:MAG TPA: hypothetical protein DCM28_17315 [Phycisphaerales bacterium]|nr:hypothetical protein [Phycisphaerales bacterium]|tara:strand:- start:9797 stop:10660 length:864 start_codon:yes stop_codon:yes gene_type:complete